jgi:hypothetical protein
MRSALIGSNRNRVLHVALCAAGLLLPLAAQAHEPREWIPFTDVCDQPPFVGVFQNCWNPHTRFGGVVSDLSAAQVDNSKKSNPNPDNTDLVSGASGTLPSFWYGFKNAATRHEPLALDSSFCSNNGNAPGCEPDTRQIVYLAMRLNDSPLLTSGGPPGLQEDGPFTPNSAWNFIFDFNGDGWSDIIASVTGGSGKPSNDPDDPNRYDDQVLAFNLETTGQQFGEFAGAQFTETRLCTAANANPRGDVLAFHDSNRFGGNPVAGCTTGTDAVCDFGITRVERVDTNMTDGDPDYILMMQMPLSWFDDCHPPDGDNDNIRGSQLLDPNKPFSMCVTTSTTASDYTNKDLAFRGTFAMSSTQPVVCSDSCSLADGCRQEPVLAETNITCPADNIVNLSVEVLDTLTTTGAQVSDSIQSVEFFYVQDENGSNWTSIGFADRDAVSLSTWEIDWDTTGLDMTPSTYFIRAVITDDPINGNSNVTDLSPVSMDLLDPLCATEPNPVTLASFRAARDGSLVRFDWSTETEAGNAGFNLLVKKSDGTWRRLNEQPIPAAGIDSAEPHSYSFEAFDVDGDVFAIEDIDVRGRATRRGPYEPRGGSRQEMAKTGAHQHHGPASTPDDGLVTLADTVRSGRPAQPEEIDWAAIHAARAAGSSAKGPQARTAAARSGASTAMDLLVDRNGLYRVTYEQLTAAGVDFAGAHPNHLALLNQGQPVPIRVVAGKSFGPGSFIEFFGEAVSTLYTRTNVYRLLASPQHAQRVGQSTSAATGAAPTSYMATVELERDRIYSVSAPGSDPWYDTHLVSSGAPSRATFDLLVDRLAAGSAATLSVDVWGRTQWLPVPDHHVRVRVNGSPVADVSFDGVAEHRIVASIPNGVLREGSNAVEVELVGDLGMPVDITSIDGFALSYPRAFQAKPDGLRFTAAGSAFEVNGLTSSAVEVWRLGSTPVRLAPAVSAGTGGFTARFAGAGGSASYAVVPSGGFLTPGLRPSRPEADLLAGAADYLIIAHGDFLGSLGPLVTQRRNQGLDVKVVDVADVYAQYGHGIFGAEPIRAYVREAASELGVRYLLLVGGDTYDYANVLGLGSISFVPSLYARTGEFVTYAPADPLFGDVDGDQVPDIAVGRLPVRTAAELDVVIGKILTYRDAGHQGTALFAADLFDVAFDISYSDQSEHLIRSMPAGWSAERAYLEGGTAQAKASLLANLNAGVAFANWMGHSGNTAWSMQSIFSATEASQLTNYGRPTVVSQWGCWNTYYVSPRYDTLGHKLLLTGDQGAAAVLGSATLSDADSQGRLAELVTPLLLAPGTTLGDAMVQAKRQLAASHPGRLDVLIGWTLLGDPAMGVQP